MTKLFKLNCRQEIEIPITHPLYNDVLIAVLANQDITTMLKDILIKSGYGLGPITNAYYILDEEYRIPPLIKL